MTTSLLADLCDISIGRTPSRDNPAYWGGPNTWLSISDLNGSEYVSNSKEGITDLAIKECGCRLVPEGTLLMSFKLSIGKTAFAGRPLFTNEAIAALSVKDKGKLDSRYLKHYLRSMDFTPLVDRAAKGKTLNKAKLERIKIQLPDLNEQRRIATILDKADAIRRKRRQAIDLMNDFLRSVFLEMFGDPDANPKGYPEPELKELLEAIDSGRSPVCLSRKAVLDEWGVLKLSAVTGCSYRSDENKALPLEETPDPSNEVKVGDILFARKNTYELVGDCAFVWQTRAKLLLPDLIFRLKLLPSAQINPLYLWGVLTSSTMRNRIRKLAGGTAGSMPNISKSRLETLRVPLPPMADQERYEITARKIQEAKLRIKGSLENIEQLFVSLSNEMFG